MDCASLENMVREGFSEEDKKQFRRMNVNDKLKLLRRIFSVYVDKNFYKTPGSTCSLERENGGNEFCGLKIDLTDTLRYRPMEFFKEKINTPPNLSFLRDSQKKGFIIGGLYRSGLHTDPLT